MIKLKYLITPYKKSNIQAGEGESIGSVPFYTSSEGLKLYIDRALYPSDSISMGTGGFASINYSDKPFSTSTDCFNFRANKKATTKFLYYWVYSRIDIVDDLFFWGMGLKHLQKPYFLNEKVKLPDIQKQKQITTFLDKKVLIIDNLISNLKGQNEELNKYLSSFILEKLVGKYTALMMNKTLSRNCSKTSEVIKVSQVIKSIKVGPFGSDLSGSDVLRHDTGHPIFDQRCVLDDNYSDFRTFVSNQKFRSMKSFYSKSGDFLLTSRGTIGKASICSSKITGVLHPCLIKVRFINDAYNKYFLYLFNYTDVLLDEIRLLSSQTTIEALYSYNLLRLYIPNFSIEEMWQKILLIEEKILSINNLLKHNSNKINNLKCYKKSLIYEYVSGKKEVSL